MKTELEIFIDPITEDRPSLKAFKKYMCNKYRVENVDEIKITIQEYAEQMDIFESGWYAKEQMLINRLLKQC